MSIKVHLVPVLQDNYIHIIEGENRQCVIVDPAEAQPVEMFLQKTV